MYYFESVIGTFWIKYDYNNPEWYYLGIDDTIIGSYRSILCAAEDVRTHATGYAGWDELSRSVYSPESILEWQKLRI